LDVNSVAEQAIPNGLAAAYYEEFISDDDVALVLRGHIFFGSNMQELLRSNKTARWRCICLPCFRSRALWCVI
jgi:dTDP-glucose pyrophosphorylase